MGWPGPTRETWLAQEPAADRPLAGRFSHFCEYDGRPRRWSYRVRYLGTEESFSMASVAPHIPHGNLRCVDRRDLVPRSDPQPGSPDGLYRSRSDLCFGAFLNRSFFESGEGPDRDRSMVFRFRAVTSRVLEIFGPSDGPGGI